MAFFANLLSQGLATAAPVPAASATIARASAAPSAGLATNPAAANPMLASGAPAFLAHMAHHARAAPAAATVAAPAVVAAPAAAAPGLQLNSSQVLALMASMAGTKGGGDQKKTKKKAAAGSSTSSGPSRRHRSSTSDTFSPAWKVMGDCCKHDKIAALRNMHPLIGSLQNKEEWELDAVIWRVTGLGPNDDFLDRSKSIHNSAIRIEYLRNGELLAKQTFEQCLKEVLQIVGLIAAPVAAILKFSETDPDVQELSMGTTTLKLNPPESGKWELGVDPTGVANFQ